MTIDDLDTAVSAYIECALWAGLDWTRAVNGNNPPLDENYGPEDVAEETCNEIRDELRDFVTANLADLDALDAEQVGHDFYLTRNGHGAGFWDRGLGEIGERLTKATKAYGTDDLLPASDGKLYRV